MTDTPTESASQERQRRYRVGRWSETAAALLLRAKGYRILARRYRSPVGEIDLIARRGKRLAFVEVKRRRRTDEGIEAITPRLQTRLARAAEHWLARHAAFQALDIAVDVIVVTPWRLPLHMPDVLDHVARARRGRG